MPQTQQAEALELFTPRLTGIEYRGLKMLENGVRSLYDRELPFIKMPEFTDEEQAQASSLFRKSLGLNNSVSVLIRKFSIRTAVAPFQTEEALLYCTCELYQVGEEIKPLHLKIRFGEKGKAKDWQFYFNNISNDGYAYEVKLHPDSENVGKEN